MLFQTSAVLFALTGCVMAQDIECDGRRFPNYDACDKYVESWEGQWDAPVGQCQKDVCWVRGDSPGGNCIVATCYLKDDCELISHDTAWVNYHLMKPICEPADSGARINRGDDYVVTAYNDPDWTGDTLRTLANWTTADDGTLWGKIKLEDLEALYEQPQEAKRVAESKRQAEDFDLVVKYEAVTKVGEKYQVSSILTPGVVQEWSREETISVGIEMNIGMEAGLWEAFTLSMGLSMSMEHSVSVGQSLQYSSGICPGDGIVYYYPLYDHYIGHFGDNAAEQHEIWIPRELDGFTDGRFRTECLG